MLGDCTERLEEPKTGCLVNITWNTSQSKALIQTDINLPKAQNYSSAVKKAQECSQESLLEPVPAVWPHPAVAALSCCAALLEFLPTPQSLILPLLRCSSHSGSIHSQMSSSSCLHTGSSSGMSLILLALKENSSVLSEHCRAMLIYFYFKYGFRKV